MVQPSSPVHLSSSSHPTSSTTAQLKSMDDSIRLQLFLKITQKLDEKNFHLWHQQIEPYINAHGLTDVILSFVRGCNHAHQLWDSLFNYFQKQTRAKARQLRVELRALSLDNSSIQEYLLKICNIVDALASIGDPIPSSHHIDVILEGLPPEFTHVVFVIESKFDVMDLDEVDILLLAHELRLNKFKKQSPPDLVSLNLTHAASTGSTTKDSVAAISKQNT
ncbi:uncharacterized protein LOC131597854 [Vicia villosa]|uniref:uncharacterized protein LOC131597854 n=1 Tax=Vicia villosa TaxID=3911 RepID=UPI00273B32FB|nr:uncharacterized protein LOC131597854 [Vicia villosa]